MSDVHSKEQRRKNMQHIRGKDTKIELILRKALWSHGYRYRKNYAKLPGKPDIVLTKQHIVIFCDSEFFHGKDWEILKTRLQKCNNGEFWIQKIEKNMARDEVIDKALRFLGWTVLHFWGEEIKCDVVECVRTIEETIFENRVATYVSDEGFV